MKRLFGIVVFLFSLAAPPAWGSSHDIAALFEGEVRKVDKDAKKITLRHGAMPTLDMPAHTMVFQVKDPAMLDQVKPGDKVRFHAEKRGGAFTITEIRPAQN
jgi:Cu(I)/Ag(I) efflux system periplasmic protein CusF